ncbi:MAG: GH92 family glycosyl hydrolase [Bacteroidales bacterium]|jgi:predicted alpha-1,2-mannosidase|nr:GH92 family glycosyl hydrolase [Bacteroidales bacterium]
MKKVLPALLVLLLPQAFFAQQISLTQYVNPFIGTQEMGHTFPGACLPFGFVQLSPDTDTIPYEKEGKYNPEVYRYCAGYQYLDNTIVGFSHTHFNGTGHSDLGDFLLMPTVGKLQLNPGTAEHPETGYRSRFRKETEQASPGYYRVHLDDPDVEAELTATTRCGFHQYTFPKSDSVHFVLDMVHGIYNYDGKVLWAYVRVVNDTLVTGYRMTSGWARNRYIYFAMVFSKPITSYGYINADRPVYRGFWRKFNIYDNFPEMAGKKIRAHFDFTTSSGEKIKVKIGLSAVSMKGALKNLETEIPYWDFEKTRAEANTIWENELNKIRIDGTDDQKINFYTAFYHALQSPMIYMDVDGRYRGIDQEIHQAVGFTNYTTFSLWDTYRALHPLLTLLYPQRTSDMVNSMLAHFDQSAEKMLPVWSHHGNENWCMIGYHSVAVIADAWVKGIRGYDGGKAFRACVSTATNRYYDGIGDYMKLGFVPEDKLGNSASITLEYAYDDFTIAQFAKALERSDETSGIEKMAATEQIPVFTQRAGNFRNLFDKSTGFIRAKNSDGSWKMPFDPLSTHGQGFIEGNSWNYSFFVPQNVPGLISLMGGDKPFIRRLDSLFTMRLDDTYFAETEDVTREGLIGNYVHGNEPSHHVAYLYNWTSQPWKTQERIHLIVNAMYHNKPNGLCGNDDCGQMSAWYIFSVLGFYPVCPGTTGYAIGSPCVSSATLSLPDGKSLIIKAIDLNDHNIYIKSTTLNGKPLDKPFIDHADLISGGELIFHMGARPKIK